MQRGHLAIDLGASSGRAIVGVLSGDPPQLSLEEVHRFQHGGYSTPTGPVWDLTGIWRNILEGLAEGARWCRNGGVELTSIGVDTWGVDWVLVGRGGELLALPHCYRDPRNEPACEQVLEKLGGFDKLYQRTGIQLMPFNTLFQVAAQFAAEPKLFDAAERLLFLPELFHYWLSGEMLTELSIASTSSMLDIHSAQWDRELLEQLGLPTHILGEIRHPGAEVGTLRAELAEETGAPEDLKIIAPACHDTGSAVAAVPVASDDSGWAYLSSGTWSLLGTELDRPLNSEAAAAAPFTNERGVNGTVRFLKNIAGLWLIQELQRDFEQEGTKLTFSEMVQQAKTAAAFRTLLDPNHGEFASPGDMAAKIKAFAQASSQPEPQTHGQLVRCCLESLAFCYSHTIKQLESVIDRRIERLHIVGGGIKNQLLNQMSASACNMPAFCGPVEATATGNLLVQAMGMGTIKSLPEARQIVARSFPVERIDPADNADQWAEHYERYLTILD